MNRIFPQGSIFRQTALFAFVLSLLFGGVALAHPIPDIPVRTFFPGDGSALITVEVEPRCMEADPDTAPSFLPPALAALTPEQRKAMEEKAAVLVSRSVEFFLEPIGRIQPEFKYRFTGKSGAEIKSDTDVLVLTGEWRTTIAEGLTGYKIRSLPEGKLSVVFQNIINGEVHPRLAVLFPGEPSFTLDLAELKKGTSTGGAGERVSSAGGSTDGWSTFVSFVRQGFIHVVPLGLDHILFVLGVFLLSRSWKPLLAQVTTFTLAHSVTLALATFGVVQVSSSIVEPIIAASIAAVALENVFRPRYTKWRLLVVFLFGLIHGLGFAGALSDLELPSSLLAAGLVGFNVGVEGGQLAVISIGFLATFWIRNPQEYRRWVVVPGSLLIAAMGIFWTIQRVMG